MTEQKQSDLEANILIAKNIMGWKHEDISHEKKTFNVRNGEVTIPCDEGRETWDPHKYLENAWEVRLKMEDLGWTSEDRLTWMGWGNEKDHPWGYSFWFQDYHLGNHIGGNAHENDRKNAPKAISEAAIRTMMTAEGQRKHIEEIAKNAGVDITGSKGKSTAKYLKKGKS